MLPDFNRLKIFYYIFFHKSIAAAAKELYVTQSAISQHLQKLEGEIKTLLFTRLHKRLVPTPAGEKLFKVISPFMDQLEENIRSISQSQQSPSGMIRMGAPVAFGEGYFPGIFSKFQDEYPDVSFFLELGHPSVLIPKLNKGDLDFVLADIFFKKGEISKEMATFSIETIINEELILACSRSVYQASINDSLAIEQLLSCNFVSYQLHAPDIKTWFKQHFEKSSVQFNITMVVESVRGIIAGIKNNMGLGLVPSHLIKEEIAKGELIHIQTDKNEIVNHISLVQLQDKIPANTEKIFISHLRKQLESIGNLSNC